MPTSCRKRVIDRVSMGEPPNKLRKKVETIEFTLHNFLQRYGGPDELVESPTVRAHGYDWNVYVCQKRLISDAKTIIEYITATVTTVVGDVGPSMASLVLRCNQHSNIRGHTRKKILQPVRVHRSKTMYTSKQFLRRNDVPRYLKPDGSMVFECDIMIGEKDKRVWYPENSKPQSLLVKLYQDASSDTADVVFAVGDATYRAHKSILSLRCKTLYELAKESSSNDVMMPISITTVRGEIFKKFLDFVYTVKMPEMNDEHVAIELLVAADCYDCVELKLYIESVLVDKFLKTSNAAASLLLADSHSCALLKEAAIDWIVADLNSVKQTNGWSKIEESNKLLKELLDSLYSKTQLGKNDNNNNTSNTSKLASIDQVERMDVTDLREELQRANLPLDGSREVLVRRWKTYQQSEKN